MLFNISLMCNKLTIQVIRAFSFLSLRSYRPFGGRVDIQDGYQPFIILYKRFIWHVPYNKIYRMVKN